MPYKLRKVPRKDLYWVVDDTGKHYSKEGLPKEKAREQQKALYAAQSSGSGRPCPKGTIGGCRCGSGKQGEAIAELYSGAGFVDVFNKITGKVKEVAQRVVDVAQKGMRKDLPPKSREILRKYANWNIMGINIRRDPIQSALNSALNAITLGSWDRMKRVLHYDKLFHLGLEIDLRFGKRNHRVLFEKNEVINLGSIKGRDNDTELLRVDMKGKQLTLGQLVENARNQMGDKFIPYDPFYNNCQDFILNVLRASGLATEDEATFIKQPIEKLIQGIPDFAPKVAKAVTDLGGFANNVLEGEGRLDMATGMFHRAFQPLSGGRVSEAAQRLHGGITAERAAEYARLKAAQEKLFAENPAIKAAAIERDRRLRSPEYKAEQAAKRAQEGAVKKAEVEGFQARQRQVKEYNEEMRRRRESGFAPLVEGLTKAGDIGVKYIAPIVGVPKIVTEAYKAFAPPGSEFYQGTGRLVGGSRFHDILFDTVDKLRQHINSYQIPEDVAQMLHRDLRQLETEAFTLMNKLSTPRAKARMTELDRKTRKYRIVKLFFKYATTELADIGLGEGLDDLMKPMRDNLDSLHDRIHAELAPEAESTDVSEAEDNKTPDRIIRPRAPEDEGSSSSNVASSSNTGSSSNSATGNGRLVGGGAFDDILFGIIDTARDYTDLLKEKGLVTEAQYKDFLVRISRIEKSTYTSLKALNTREAKARFSELLRASREYNIISRLINNILSLFRSRGFGSNILDYNMSPVQESLDYVMDKIRAKYSEDASSTDISEAEDNKTTPRVIRPSGPENEGSSSSNVASSSNTGSSSNSATGNGRYRRFAGGAKKKDDADDELARIFGRMGMSDSDEDDGMAPPSFGAPATGRETNMEKMLASRKSASPPRSNAAAAPAALAKPVALVKPVAVKAVPKGVTVAPGKSKTKRSAASDSEEEKSASNKKTGKGRAAAVEFVALEPSKAKGKKWTVRLRAGGRPRVVHFGAAGAEDFTISKDNKRKALYIQRHKAREDWTKAGVLTPGFWAKHLLWNKPTVEASLAATRQRFKL
jgi:hypothetical protein